MQIQQRLQDTEITLNQVVQQSQQAGENARQMEQKLTKANQQLKQLMLKVFKKLFPHFSNWLFFIG